MSDFDLSELPANAQEYIRELRRESAKYRTERNDFRDKIAERDEAVREANKKFEDFDRLREDHEKTLADNSKLNLENGRMKAAGKAGIFEHYDRIQGEKPEDWEKDASELAEKFGTKKPPGVPKDDAAGNNPGEPKSSPLAEAFRKAGFDLP